MTDNIEKLYQYYDVLADAKEDITKHEKEYLEILGAVKGSDKEKRLASQFITKFFSSFPHLAEQAIDAQFDLCEDDDVAIRKQAIKDLPGLCKDGKEHTQRISDILAQLLQTEDTSEFNVVTSSLIAVLKSDTIGALKGIFAQIHQGADNETVRERCIKFLVTKVKLLGREIIQKEAEDLIIEECKKLLEDVTAEEFEQVMELLGWSRMGRTPVGRKELVGLVAAQALVPADWNPAESELVDKLIQCSSFALPYFSSQIDSTAFIVFFCTYVLPKLQQVEAADHQLELLKLFAELSSTCGTLEQPEDKIDTVYKCLLNYLPDPPVEVETSEEKSKEGESTVSLPSLQFSHVECALFALHSLARQAPASLTSDADKLKVLRLRLQYTARLTQGYIKKLKEVTQGKKQEDKPEEHKIKVVALKTTSNINTLIKDLFHTPPSFKSKVQLSFQTKSIDKIHDLKESRISVSEDDKTSVGQKRHKPITFGDGEGERERGDGERGDGPAEKRMRSDRPQGRVYAPPSGKYSNSVSGGGRYSGNGNSYSGNGNSYSRGGGRWPRNNNARRGGIRNGNGNFRRRNY